MSGSCRILISFLFASFLALFILLGQSKDRFFSSYKCILFNSSDRESFVNQRLHSFFIFPFLLDETEIVSCAIRQELIGLECKFSFDKLPFTHFIHKFKINLFIVQLLIPTYIEHFILLTLSLSSANLANF